MRREVGFTIHDSRFTIHDFTDKLGYDIYSYDSQYEKELKVIQRLWENAEEGTNKNISSFLELFNEQVSCDTTHLPYLE